MKQTERIKHLVFCSILFSLEIIILLLTYFYSLFYYQLNWLSYLWYFVSWWSVQTDCLILLFALGGLIYFTKCIMYDEAAKKQLLLKGCFFIWKTTTPKRR
ncbi:hypothetical protein [Spiroplasma citri]|uniref:hypothetical protein n=1 Tax=Spiroplasma citri TaxID=2133 RepID=UPI00286EEE2F|nr:hypothetical protein [Spiroplasma citri]